VEVSMALPPTKLNLPIDIKTSKNLLLKQKKRLKKN
jgi:hypothetical protein